MRKDHNVLHFMPNRVEKGCKLKIWNQELWYYMNSKITWATKKYKNVEDTGIPWKGKKRKRKKKKGGK